MLPLLAVKPMAPLLRWTAPVALAYHVVIGYEASGVWVYDRTLIGLEYVPPSCGSSYAELADPGSPRASQPIGSLRSAENDT